MKDWLTILICNSIRAADHRRNELEVSILSDEEVLKIAARARADYHKSQLIQVMNAYQALLVESTAPGVGGSVTPPEDLIEAARKSLGDRFDEFHEIHGPNFTPVQLAQFCDGIRYGPGV